MKVLIVEDEPKLCHYLCRALQQNGFVADTVADGPTALHLALNGEYDAIVLDAMLPGLDGFSVLRRLRETRQTPVLMLTALGAVEDRVRGLTDGADDYLSKPFAISELLARLRAITRRGVGGRIEPTTFSCFDLDVDLIRRRAQRAGRRLDLTAMEFSLLTLLIKRQGEVLSRSVIAEQVWDMNFDSDTNVVEAAIRRLRIKVDDPFPRKLILTIRGMGYVLEAPKE